MTDFVKDDSNKLEPSLIPWVALYELAAVFTHGRHKYDATNFEKCDKPQRYIDAMERHWLAYHAGEVWDPDSGLHHLAHMAASAMILMHLDLPKDFLLSKNRLANAITLGKDAKKRRGTK